jgi:hypothetical protein
MTSGRERGDGLAVGLLEKQSLAALDLEQVAQVARRAGAAP